MDEIGWIGVQLSQVSAVQLVPLIVDGIDLDVALNALPESEYSHHHGADCVKDDRWSSGSKKSDATVVQTLTKK